MTKRLTVRPKIKPLDPNAKLAPYSVPDIPRSKFKDIPGQAAMDFSSDEWDALVCEVCGNACTNDVCGTADCTCG
jgi:hypothetical protein